jgi:uncharacterized protein YgfB (UPF0149 family)
MTHTPPNDAETNLDRSIDYDQLDAVLQRLRLGTTTSELHGSLCGYLAGGGVVRPGALFADLQMDGEPAAPSAADQAVLEQLVRDAESALADPEMGFEPLLPADDRPLPERAEALAEWCRGLLGGFGLAGAAAHADLSEEAREMLHDLGTIAASNFAYGEHDEDEDALIEVQEFVRVGAMLLHAECAARGTPASGRVH